MEEVEKEDILSRHQRGYILVDLDAILENMHHMKQNIKADTKMIAVIKTDGYGHGSVPIAQTLDPLDYLFGFAVATAEEAFALRQAGIKKPILILGYTFPYCYEQLAEQEIRPAVFRKDTIQELGQAAKKAGKPIRVHIKVDTGMSRIGVTPDAEGIEFVKELSKQEGIIIEGIFTHFARADEKDKTSAEKQLEIFRQFIDRIEKECSLTIPVKHCSNSAGILELPQANMDVVRAGITLYGLYPSEEVEKDKVLLRPALSWYSQLVYVKTLHKGQSVSYGGTFTAEKEIRVATVPMGYGDGYPRSLSNKGYVLLHGKKAPILGRVCMDQFMIDVSEIPEAKEGDWVTLLGAERKEGGTDASESITAEMLGELSGRFNYELVCDLGKRVPRVYLKDGKLLEAGEIKQAE